MITTVCSILCHLISAVGHFNIEKLEIILFYSFDTSSLQITRSSQFVLMDMGRLLRS